RKFLFHSQNRVHLPSKAQDISTSQPSDRRVHSFLQLRAAPDKDWPGSALASPGQSLIQSILLLQASFLCCPLNLDRFSGRIKLLQEVFAMPRKYSHIQEHEKEIIELRSQGMTLRQIGEKLGFTYKEMRGFLSRYNRKQRKLAAGVPPKSKGR